MRFSGQHRRDTRHTRGAQASVPRLPLQRRLPVVHRSGGHHLLGLRPGQVGCGPRDGGHSRPAEGARVPDAHHPQQGRHRQARGVVARPGRPHLEHLAIDVLRPAAADVHHLAVDPSLPGWCSRPPAARPGARLFARPAHSHRQAHRAQDRQRTSFCGEYSGVCVIFTITLLGEGAIGQFHKNLQWIFEYVIEMSIHNQFKNHFLL